MYIQLLKQGHIAILTVSRPEALNALNMAVLDELELTARAVGEDRTIRALVVTGAGKAFVAGADISEMSGLDEAGALELARRGQRAITAIEELEIPVIAAINGYALGGGCELALACDIRLAGERAKLGQPETGLGITPGFGGTQRLPRVIGMNRALEMIYTGRVINAEEAFRIGLVNRVCGQDELMDCAVKLAEEIAANAPHAVRSAKRAARRFTDSALADDLAFEAEAFAKCFNTEDQKMAMRAFVEKRKHEGFKGE